MSSVFPLAAAPATDIDVSMLAWGLLGVLVVALLVIDLLVFARHHAPTVRESIVWSVVWLALALVFGAGFWLWQGGQAGSEYYAGYLLERSLSLDNVFVFAVILSYFAVPRDVQPSVLSWGIVLALALRLVFILMGAALLDAFHATFYLFGLLLLYTAYKLARHADAEINPEHNPVLRGVRRFLPLTDSYDGERLITRRGRRLIATPLFAVFVVVATTDVIFAVDSIPAIFAVTREPFIVFAANAFAMLGLRALYFLLAGLRDRFAYLSHGLAVILAFIGVKMLLVDIWHVPIWLSLTVIVVTLALTALLSMRADAKKTSAA
ncbi:MAG TPA: TerC/Alx family metal homeostasis membrane protein [Candidatus Dormibacteraeota bacterium]|nr:TerC/Alx family metal homeostasis membrane protein [Candidatus Dormibacteraeota bacterium]